MERATDRSVGTLRRIADALDIPVEVLFAQTHDGPSIEELDGLLRAFNAVTDLVLRRRCLAQVRAAASACAADARPDEC